MSRQQKRIATGKARTNSNQAATTIAERAHVTNFSTRRNIIAQADGFYIFDNNPFADDPARRKQIYDGLIAHMAGKACKLVGRGSFPPPGQKDASYTIALVFKSASRNSVAVDAEAAGDFLRGAALSVGSDLS
jgi:hypothetical protein